MPQITPDDLELQRDSIRGSLNEINNDIAMEMRDAGLAGFRSIWSSRTVVPL
jgi:hypothetical protein